MDIYAHFLALNMSAHEAHISVQDKISQERVPVNNILSIIILAVMLVVGIFMTA